MPKSDFFRLKTIIHYYLFAMDPEGFPEEIRNFLFECGIDERRVESLKFNVVNSFTNARNIADLISSRFPKLLAVTAIEDASSSALRLENWKKLNKTLTTLRSELNDEKLMKFVTKKITKEEIFNFLLNVR